MAGWDRYADGPGGRGLRLVIVGAGPLEDEVAAWASGRPEVSAVGQVEPQKCAELMSAARAVLIPSAWEETFGLVAIEAMECGVPPIATNHGSFPELITPGVDGVLFQHDDPAALASVLADVEEHPGRYDSYGEQARKSYERRFNPDCSIEQLLEVYRYAISHPVRYIT
jgi:glycosyltransferase involved in cell wall biosynthesis